MLLHASALFKRAIPPVICFNLGSLGFLTNHAFVDFRRDLRDVIHGGEGLEECSLPGEEIRVGHHWSLLRVTTYCWGQIVNFLVRLFDLTSTVARAYRGATCQAIHEP